MYMISIFHVAVYQLQYSGFILENLTRGTNYTTEILGGGGGQHENMCGCTRGRSAPHKRGGQSF